MDMIFDDSKLDNIMKNLKTWSDKEKSAYLDEQAEHPLFMPDPASTGGGANPYVNALQNVVYDELDSPQSLAREAKERGNAAFKRGAALYGNAIRHFHRGRWATRSAARRRRQEYPAMQELISVVRLQPGRHLPRAWKKERKEEEEGGESWRW
jgi:hypothetical protein